MGLFDPAGEQLNRRSPIGRWQIVQVDFSASDRDTVVPHDLPTPDPEQVDYEVLRANGPVSVYHDGSASRRVWGQGFIVVRSSVAPVVADIRLSVSTTPLQQRTLPRGTPGTPTTNAGTLDGLDSSFFLDMENASAGTLALARGGTNAALSDPGADRILFWDDSGNTTTWLQPGSGVAIVGTTLTATGGGIDIASTATVPDDGAGTTPAFTLTPASSYVQVTNADPDGADITLSEVGAVDGQRLLIVNVGANPITFTASAGVQELPTPATLAQWQALSLIYVLDRWVEVSRS